MAGVDFFTGFINLGGPGACFPTAALWSGVTGPGFSCSHSDHFMSKPIWILGASGYTGADMIRSTYEFLSTELPAATEV